MYESELATTQVDQNVSKKSRRISTIETLLENERRLLREDGRRSSKRLRKLTERWERILQSSDECSDSPEDWEESGPEGLSEIEKVEGGSTVIVGGVTRLSRGELVGATNEQLAGGLAGLEKSSGWRRSKGLEFRIGEKGGVSVYGIGRFPITLYYNQWVRLLDAGEALRAFVEENKAAGRLMLKQR